METHYPTVNVPATPEYVLNVILDRQLREWLDESDSYFNRTELMFNSRIDDLVEVEAGVFWDFDDIVFEIYDWFEMDCSESEWWCLIRDINLRTIGDLCNIIAAHATVPTIQLTTFCGTSCRPASAFLTIRSILDDAGGDTTLIGPSTPLHEFTRKHLETFLGPISRLASGKLPEVIIDDGGYHKLKLRRDLCLISTVVSSFLAKIFSESQICLLLFVSMLFLCLVSYLRVDFASKNKCISAQFGDLRTFRDLSELIAKHASVSPA